MAAWEVPNQHRSCFACWAGGSSSSRRPSVPDELVEKVLAARVRLDPLDPKTSRHAGECEFKDVTDPAVIRVFLRITEKDGYRWVQCGSCECGWQVPFYAEERIG
jgi:hypothetical protein